jgi:RNA 2',3'-cyclic 3'-phosphodiesterase
MSKPTANLRLFAAIYPPLDVARSLIMALNGHELPRHRLTPIEQIHMTVQFIGDTPARELDATIESVQRGCSGISPFALQMQRLISLPERGQARLIAVELNSCPALLELHRRLVSRLARQPRERQRERYRPHMTLCRFPSPTRFKINAELPALEFTVTQVKLMRSTLATSGAHHHEVNNCVLA